MKLIYAIALYVLFLCGPHTATAQRIAIKTVPVATGDQFLIFPSQNMGMGGVTIALEDALGDPFSNPARGAYVEETQFISTPLFYSISPNGNFSGNRSGGTARTLPVGMLSGKNENNAFGGMMVAWQQLNVERPVAPVFWGDPLIDVWVPPTYKSDNLDNLYAFATGGMQSENQKISVGVSMFAGKLNGVEGVRLLYSQGDDVAQDGALFEFRVGMTAELTPQSDLDFVVLHHRFNMEQKINSSRTEKDETNGLGLNLGYVHRMEDGWRLGGEVVSNWQWHPKIPNYDIMQIPRDPGNSSAYNIGVGVAREHGQVTVGLDLIYEPIRSHTWANAESDIPILDDLGQPIGTLVPAGEKTVENFFRFNNRIVRAGIRQTGDRFDLQLGLDVHTIRYHMDQTNYELRFDRSQNERWNEWTVNAGIALKFTTLEIRYLGRLTLGTGQPGTASTWWGWGCPTCERSFAAGDANFIIAPNGELTLQEARVFTNQFSIHVPIGRE